MKSTFSSVNQFETILQETAPYMASAVEKGRIEFGQTWESRLEESLKKIFKNDPKRLKHAAEGYARFALDSMRLQKRFEKEKIYIPKTFSQAAEEVYNNREYMFDLYLPGIFLSHYLWPHHYRQLCYFVESFVPLVAKYQKPEYCEVGVGTGFYSRMMLDSNEFIQGNVFDISPHSLDFAKNHVAAFGFGNRWSYEHRNILENPPDKKWPVLISVEVLEHLEDPLKFLKALRKILASEGTAFITAAITAPNEDHIYLYNNYQEIIDQLEEAGFSIFDFKEEIAYEPKHDEPVPRIASFIVG